VTYLVICRVPMLPEVIQKDLLHADRAVSQSSVPVAGLAAGLEGLDDEQPQRNTL